MLLCTLVYYSKASALPLMIKELCFRIIAVNMLLSLWCVLLLFLGNEPADEKYSVPSSPAHDTRSSFIGKRFAIVCYLLQ